MGAVKNVGQGPVELILEAVKANGHFTSLNDFIQRVDLRTVGKRALESLIKVGALDSLGARAALLEALDQMLSVSASHFRAASSGQLSFFGAFAEVIDDIVLPFAASLDTREQLEWERDLLGLYVSDHPLSPYLPALRRRVTHFSATLADVHNKEKVSVAGMVTRFRNHQTKSGKAMGFATIEDIQGPIELVLFPRTWEKYSKLVAPDRVLIAEGKVDAESGDPKLLVDRLEELDLEEALKVPDRPEIDINAYVPPAVAAVYGGTAFDELPADDEEEEPGSAAPAVHEKSTRYVSPLPDDAEGVPPEPDDWHLFEPPIEEYDYNPPAPVKPEARPSSPPARSTPANEVARPAAKVAPAAEEAMPAPANTQPVESTDPGPAPSASATSPTKAASPAAPERSAAASRPSASEPPPFLSMPFFVIPTSKTGAPGPGASARLDEFDEEETVPPKMLTIILRSSNDKKRDVRRLRRIHGIIQSFPGRDKFSLMVFEGGRRFLLEFPNETTGVCSELIKTLIDLVGEGNVTVEPIKIQ